MKHEITDMYTDIEEARMQMRGLAKMCVAFGNMEDEESWGIAGRAAKDCDAAMARVQERLDEMKAQVYGTGLFPEDGKE